MASPGMRAALETLLAPVGPEISVEEARRRTARATQSFRPETGYIEGGIRSALRGLAQIGREAGDALEYNREVQETGDKSRRNILNLAGSALSDVAEAGQNMIAPPQAGDNYVKQSVFGGIESLPTSLAYAIPAYAGASLGGVLGLPSGPGSLATGAAGAALGQAAASVPMYRASAQRTYEEILKANPGIDPKVAAEAARKSGRANVIGESISDIPMALIFSRIPGGKAVASTAKGVLQPGFRATAKQFAKNVAMTMPGEQLGEGYTAYKEQEAWNAAMPKGQQQDPWQAVKDSAGATAVMTLLMGGLGTGAQVYRARGAVRALEDPSTPLASRHMAVLEVASKLKESDPQKADNWLKNATISMLRGEAIPTDDTFLRSPQELAKEIESAQREAAGITPVVPFGAPQAATSPFDVSQADPNAGAFVPRTSALTGLPLADQRAFTAPQTRSPITGLAIEDPTDLGADQRALAARDAASSRVATMLGAEPAVPVEETLPPLDLISVRDSLNSKTGTLASWSNKKGGFGSLGEFAAEIKSTYPTLTTAWEQWGKPGRSELVAAINAELKGTESKNLKPETREMRQALLTALKEDLSSQQAQFLEGLRTETRGQQAAELERAAEAQAVQAEAQGVAGGDTSFDPVALEAGEQTAPSEQFTLNGRPLPATPEVRADYEARGEAIPYHLLTEEEQALADQADAETGKPPEIKYLSSEGLYEPRTSTAISPEDLQSFAQKPVSERLRLLEQDHAAFTGQAIPEGSFRESTDRKKRDTLAAVAQQFGHEVVLLAKDPAVSMDGFVFGADPNTIYISEAAENPLLSVLGHEISHLMEQNAPELFKELGAELIALSDQEGLKAYFAVMPGSAVATDGNVTREASREWVADVIGANFNRPGFWNAFAKDNPSLVLRVLEFIRTTISSVREALSRTAMAEQTVTGLPQVEKTVATYLRRYAGRMNAAYSFATLKPADIQEMKLLRPAATVNGTMYTGNVGDMHHQVMAKSGVTAWDTTRDNVRLGFVTPDGTFLRRDEAATWIQQNDQETYRNIKSPYLLESVDYGLAKGLYANESEALGKFANMYATKNAPEAAPLTKTLVQKAFPGQTVKETEAGFLVELKNGAAIRVEKTGEIFFNIAAAEAGLGRKLQPGEKPVAAWKPLDPLGMVIQLTDKGMGSIDHETFHAAVTLALTKGERTALYNKYGKENGRQLSWKEAEERMAEAYQLWRDAEKTKPDTFFQKVKDFFLRIKDLFIASPEAVFRAVAQGEVWGREAENKNSTPQEAFSFNTQTAANALNTFAQGLKRGKAGDKVSKLIQAFTPMDRMIDLMKDRKALGYVKEQIVSIGALLQKQRALQDKLLSDAKLLLDNEVLAHVKRDKGVGIDPAKLNAVHEMMARMTRWGFDPSGTVGDRFTDENLWKTTGMAEMTGLSLAAAKAKVAVEWRKLAPELQKGIVDMMLLNKKALELQREVNLRNIRQLLGDTPEAQAQVAKIEKRFKGLSGPYFTLDHPGQHVVRVFDGRTTLYAQSFDDVRDAEALKKLIEKDVVGFLKGEGRMDADKFDDIQVMYDRRAPFTRLTVHVPESFMERLKALTDKAGAVDLRKELRAIYRDAQRDVDSGRYQFPDVLMDKLKEASKAGSVKQAETILDELSGMVGAAKEEQALFDEVTASISGAGIGADLAESLKQDFEQLWIATLPESSILKNMTRRTLGGVGGYDKNMTRSFLAYHQKHARAMAFMKYGTQVQRGLREIDKLADGEQDVRTKQEAKEFTETIRAHQERVLTEKVSPLVKTLTKIPFLWYLSSPSAFIVQSSQPYTITLPFLAARFSYSKAMGAVNKAYGRQMRMEFSDKKLLEFNDTHRELIDKLTRAEDRSDSAEMNRLTKGLSLPELEKAAIAVSPTLQISLSHEAFDMISSGKPGGEGVTKKLGWFMAASETGSRKAGFIAAFNLKYEQTGDFAQATKFATDAVNDTLYDYSAGNRPKILTGNIGRLVGQFRTYQVQTLFKVGKLFMDAIGTFPISKEEKAVARKELMFLMANNFALAGVAGLPMAGTVIGLLNVFNALFGDDDEPWDAELELGNFLRGSLGEGVGAAVQKGALPALLGMDISKRIGMGGLSSVFQSDPPTGKHGADLAGWYAANALGPWFTSMVSTPLRGWDAYRKGDWVDALRTGMPKPVADLARAYTVATEGQVAGGKMLKPAEEFNPYQILLAGLGINPLEMSLASEEYRQESSYSTLITERRALLVKNFAQAAMEGDFEEAEEAKEEIRAFNERMPKFALKASDLARGVKNLKDKRSGKKNKKEKTMEEWLNG